MRQHVEVTQEKYFKVDDGKSLMEEVKKLEETDQKGFY
jgi:hypothetical protein